MYSHASRLNFARRMSVLQNFLGQVETIYELAPPGSGLPATFAHMSDTGFVRMVWQM